jgi:hypothetical protein
MEIPSDASIFWLAICITRSTTIVPTQDSQGPVTGPARFEDNSGVWRFFCSESLSRTAIR